MKPNSRKSSLACSDQKRSSAGVRGSLQTKRNEDATMTSQADTMIVHDSPIIKGGVNDTS